MTTTTITDEMVERAAKAWFFNQHSIMHDHEQLWREFDKAWLYREGARSALEAALSALPNAGEGDENEEYIEERQISIRKGARRADKRFQLNAGEGAGQSTRAAIGVPTPSASRRGEPAPTYDAKLGEITEQDREYAADLIDDYKEEITTGDADYDRKRQIETVAQWLRKVRHQTVIDDRKSRDPDRNAVIEECALIADAEKMTGIPPIDRPIEWIEAIEATVRVTKNSIRDAIRALKSPATTFIEGYFTDRANAGDRINPNTGKVENPNTESEVMPNQPTKLGPQESSDTPPHPHPSANADAGGAHIHDVVRRLREGIPCAEAQDGIPCHSRSALAGCDCAIAADTIEQLLTAQPPDGWVMVPREPTEKMRRNAIAMLGREPYFNTYKRAYSAMLAAAPKPGG